MGTLQFDGVDYLDGESSDPSRLGLMRGSPPVPAAQIRFADDRFFDFPQIRWTLSHVRELIPTVNVYRGDGAPSGLGTANDLDITAIDSLEFLDAAGVARRWASSLVDTYTDGIVVLHRGRCVYERYAGALRPELPHACFSVTKSYVGTLIAMLIHDGVLDEGRLIPFYVPEFAGTAYADATLRAVLDMQTGVAYTENYTDPESSIWEYGRAGGFRARPVGYRGADHVCEYLTTLRKEGEHEQAFAYKTVNTEVLSWLLRRVTGIPLAGLLSERVWAPLGCEQDGYLSVDPVGVELGGAGLSAGLRDLARFGEMLRRDGEWSGRQVVPAAVVADIRGGADTGKFAKAGYTGLPGYSYRNMWWVSHNELGAVEARGIHGQRLYIAPRAEMTIARFASHPVAASGANDPITLPAFLALGRALMRA